MNAEPSTSAQRTTSKLGLCEVCALQDAKYTCPKCEVKTCSLKCNNIHKSEIDCDGQRDRTKFIPLNKFTNLDLSSDYRLLEEISRTVEASRKKFGRKWNNLSWNLVNLRNAAKLRRVNLKFLPDTFVRHKSNTSNFNNKIDIIFWHIDWIFVNADNLKLSDSRVPETEKLSFVLSKHLVKQKDEVLQEKLQFYQSANIPGINVYLKAEGKIGKKFYELDLSLTLKECLAKKSIIEYPTIHVVLKNHGVPYKVIDSDDEDDEIPEKKMKSGNEVIANIVNNADNEESLYKCLKNLLFVSEYSDEDISEGEH